MSGYVAHIEPLVGCLRVYPSGTTPGRDPYAMSGSVLHHSPNEVEIKGVTSRGSTVQAEALREKLSRLLDLIDFENGIARAVILDLIDELDLELTKSDETDATEFLRYREAIATALYRSGVDWMQWTRKRTDGRPDRPVRLPTKRWARGQDRG